jgi:two-component system LytT family response regulator
MIKAVIVDDERLARKALHSLLENVKDLEIVAEFENADDALEGIPDINPDLLFLDIQMPGKTGFDLLQELDRSPEVIFTTAYDEYAIKAFEVNALDYLMKPIEEDRLNEAVEKVRQNIKERKEIVRPEVLDEDDQVFLKDGDKCWFVHLRDVSHFESVGNYVRVFFDGSKPLILKSLNNLDKRLSDRNFFRANRKHIINLKWVAEVEPWFNGGLLVKLKTGDNIEISRRQAVKLKDLMSL